MSCLQDDRYSVLDRNGEQSGDLAGIAHDLRVVEQTALPGRVWRGLLALVLSTGAATISACPWLFFDVWDHLKSPGESLRGRRIAVRNS